MVRAGKEEEGGEERDWNKEGKGGDGGPLRNKGVEKGRKGREGTGIKEGEGGDGAASRQGGRKGRGEGKGKKEWGRRKWEGKDREGECYNWH